MSPPLGVFHLPIFGVAAAAAAAADGWLPTAAAAAAAFPGGVVACFFFGSACGGDIRKFCHTTAGGCAGKRSCAEPGWWHARRRAWAQEV